MSQKMYVERRTYQGTLFIISILKVVIVASVMIKISPLSSESLDMFWEEESNVLHKLFSGEIIVTSYLEGREDFVQEAFVQVEGNEAEEMSVKQGEHLVPHRLLQNLIKI